MLDSKMMEPKFYGCLFHLLDRCCHTRLECFYLDGSTEVYIGYLAPYPYSFKVYITTLEYEPPSEYRYYVPPVVTRDVMDLFWGESSAYIDPDDPGLQKKPASKFKNWKKGGYIGKEPKLGFVFDEEESESSSESSEESLEEPLEEPLEDSYASL